jgi:NADPH:quinone reductase-like Zn-dependent oxidoreductase
MQQAVATMKAIVIDEYGVPQNARTREIDVPKIKDDMLLVRIRAAAVNPFDYKLVTGMVKDWVPISFPYVPGMDGAGEVVEIGNGVQGWQKGDAVVGMFSSGTFAQFAAISAREKRLARKPQYLDFEHAAAIPEAGLTAKTLIRAANVRAGQTVLLIGATGGVGLFATQLLKAEGARVIATGKASDMSYLRSLGADDVVDYTTADPIAQVRQSYRDGVDAVLDLINFGDALLGDAHALREGGSLVSSLSGPDQDAFPADVTVRYIQMRAQTGDLDDLVRRVAEGTLRVEIGERYNLAEGGRALADLMDRSKHTRGKLVIVIP